MNDTVTAKGMMVKAETASAFLQIRNVATPFDNTQPQISADADNAEKILHPTSLVKALSGDTLTPFDGSTIVFVEAHSIDPNNYEKNEEEAYADVTNKAYPQNDTDGNVYTLINSFYVRLNPDAGLETAANLKIDSLTITAEDDEKVQLLPAVRVLIVCGENKTLWKNGEKVAGADVLAAQVTTAESEIKVCIFFDGEDAATTTVNAAAVDLSGYSVQFKLTVNK